MSNNKSIKNTKKNTNFTNKKQIETTILFYETLIQETLISIQRNKVFDIIGVNEVKEGLDTLYNIYSKLQLIKLKVKNLVLNTTTNPIYNDLHSIKETLILILKNYGTSNLNNLIKLIFQQDCIDYILSNSLNQDIYKLLCNFSYPIEFKTINIKKNKKKNTTIINKDKILSDNNIAELSNNLDIFDLGRTSSKFHTKVYGIKIVFFNKNYTTCTIVYSILQDILISCCGSDILTNRLNSLYNTNKSLPNIHLHAYQKYIKCLTLKDMLLYPNEIIINKFTLVQTQNDLIKIKPLIQLTKEFLTETLYIQRKMLIQLLYYSNNHEYQYLAYLLYDLLTDDNNNIIDTHNQTLLFDSLPWEAKRYFREAMQQTNNYTSSLSNVDNINIPLVQQICLLKTTESVKEKAMLKLKEVKAKSEDSGSKARQYLDGLLKIPFGLYKNEEILSIVKHNSINLKQLIELINTYEIENLIKLPQQDKYNILEIKNNITKIKDQYYPQLIEKETKLLQNFLIDCNRNKLIQHILSINKCIKHFNLKISRIIYSGKNINYLKKQIILFIDKYKNNIEYISFIANNTDYKNYNTSNIQSIESYINTITTKTLSIHKSLQFINTTLNNAVYGHSNAKRQIERIIGQWINGDNVGYCFGFEGPPGVGKTSLATKGISKCLLDNNNISRPFALIAIGGSSNSSTLDGHNYTYVGSTWGKILEILIDTKCMNPIILIDEVDKVSKTENGKEIISILTHLIDPSQNNKFQDKYFSGIELDLSKALFILSYNDPDAIDRILLDRVHRIKFNPLTVEDKITICNTFILPEIYNKMGLDISIIELNNEILEFIILEYTCEAGVRKLKEILFEVIGEINLKILYDLDKEITKFTITKQDILNKYLKNRKRIKPKYIPKNSLIGQINGLWANTLGKGGILPIEIEWCYGNKPFELLLTGKQGDIMRESMEVAKTLAIKLAMKHNKKQLTDELTERTKSKTYGLHIHVPEGATPKDGPSAGSAITVCIYSLLTKQPIPNDIAMTGEICLRGHITEIGGLDLKLSGGIVAGVKRFLYPKDNKYDFDLFIKDTKNDIIRDIDFKMVDNIIDVIKYIFNESN